jgi:hypothetical protein
MLCLHATIRRGAFVKSFPIRWAGRAGVTLSVLAALIVGGLSLIHASAAGAAASGNTFVGHSGFTACDGYLESGTVIGMATTPDDDGYWIAGRTGRIVPCGDAPNLGSLAFTPSHPIVGIAATPDGGGLWLVASDGGIFSFGDAKFYGSTGSLRLNQPIVAMTPTADGMGYWLVAADGGIFSFGDAQFYGSTGGLRLNAPVVGMAAQPSGAGYWLVASDGGIFSFGAPFFGSMGGTRLNRPVVGITTTDTGGGYRLVGSDGGIFSFNAPFYGSTGGIVLNQPVVGMEAAGSGTGYRFVAADGGIFSFGSSQFFGSAVAPPGTNPGRPDPGQLLFCSLSMAIPSPGQYPTEVVGVVSSLDDTGVSMTVQYGAVTSSYSATTDSSGVASVDIDISGATLGDPVEVTAVVGNSGTSSAKCSTSFVASSS